MSQNLPNMLDSTLAKIREMIDVNSVIGDPITTVDGITIIPVFNVSVGFGGGGSDFISKNPNNQDNHPFGGGAVAGMKVNPVAFLVVKEGNVRILSVSAPASTTAERIVDLVPETLDRIANIVDSHTQKTE